MKFPLLARAPLLSAPLLSAPLLSALLLSLSLASPALAEETESKSTEEPALVPFENNLVKGHVQIGASAAYAAPFGRLSDESSRLDRAGGGGTFGLDLNYGVDRFVFLGVYGQYSLFGNSSACEDCKALEWGTGMQVGYHLVQGLRIDPWISYGVGFRRLKSQLDGNNASYNELEWMRLSMGTDWYVAPSFALSPFAMFSAASTVTAHGDEMAGRVDMRFVFGLRLALDIPGR